MLSGLSPDTFKLSWFGNWNSRTILVREVQFPHEQADVGRVAKLPDRSAKKFKI